MSAIVEESRLLLVLLLLELFLKNHLFLFWGFCSCLWLLFWENECVCDKVLCIEEIEWLKNPRQQQACFVVFFSGIQHTYVHATRFEGRFPCPFSFRFSKSQSQECESLKWVSRSLLLLLPSTVCIPRALLMVQMFVGISARFHSVPMV